MPELKIKSKEVMRMSSTETNMIRIDKIKREMGAHDLTKTSLAEKLKVDPLTLARKLKGEYPWTVAELEKLAEIFKVERNYFF